MTGPLLTASLVLACLVLLRGPSAGARLRRVIDGPAGRSPAARRTSPLRWRRRRPAPRVRALAERWAAGARAGRAVDDALSDALAHDPATSRALPRVANAVRLDGDVAAALRADAAEFDERSSAPVRALAACWTVGRQRGGGLAAAVERVAETVRADELHRAHVRSELAGALASARLLAALPLLVLLLGVGTGLVGPGDLVGSRWSVMALVAGLALDAIGLWWTVAVMRSAERAA